MILTSITMNLKPQTREAIVIRNGKVTMSYDCLLTRLSRLFTFRNYLLLLLLAYIYMQAINILCIFR